MQSCGMKENELAFSLSSAFNQDVDLLCAPSQDVSQRMIRLLKDLYDVSSSSTSKSFGPFSTLTIDGLDLESLWEQVQTRNRPLLRFIKKKSGALIKAMKSNNQKSTQLNELAQEEDEDEDEEEDEGEEEGDQQDDMQNEDDVEIANDSSSSRDNDSEEEEEEEEEEEGESGEHAEDHAFLDDMEAFLDAAEEREEKFERKQQRREQAAAQKGAAEEEDSDSEEDDELFVQRELYEDGEDGGEGEASYKFRDFFAKAPKRDAGRKGGKVGSKGPKSGHKYMDEEDDEEEEDDGEDFSENGQDDYKEEDEEEEEEEIPNAETLTAHQRHKMQLATQIKELEAELIGTKSWDLRGEIKGGDRPENSLLGINADIERASKPAPLVTQEYTTSLEEMILQRIKDEKYDDVVPPPPRQTISAKDEFFLSQEKDRTGLGDLYAQEFLSKSASVSKSAAQTEKEELATVELKGLFHKICRQLDALSHFQYSPRPVIAEASITANALPSISLEDITPITVSGGSAAAPEDIHKKQRGRAAALVSEAELTTDDRKRLRRASKSVRRKKLRQEETKEKEASKVGKASARFEEKKLKDTLKSDSRVQEGGTGDPEQANYANSSQFFASLQRQAQQDISSKAGVGTKSHKKGRDSDKSGGQSSKRVKL